jgi:dCTP deaminase
MSQEHEPGRSGQYSKIIYTPEGERRVEVEIAVPEGLLSRRPILERVDSGSIIVHPLVQENIGGASIDVTMGEWIWRERPNNLGGPLGGVVDPWSENAAQQLWVGPFGAKTAGEIFHDLWLPGEELDQQNVSFSPEDRMFVIGPGENILAHTQEYIGGDVSIATAMQARSSLGRSHFTVCRCAGWGDPGYVNRWTMEITNNSKVRPLVLIVGRRVAQIVFWEVEPVEAGYGEGGKYQPGSDLEAIVAKWKPQDMLPRLFLDREIGKRAWEIGEQEERSYRASQQSGVHYAIPKIETITRFRSDRAYRQYWEFYHLGLLPGMASEIGSAIAERGGLNDFIFDPDPVV